MQTLIELYDERPLENVLGVEVFRPKKVVYVCPASVARNKSLHKRLRDYFSWRGLELEVEFVRANLYRAEAVSKLLRQIAERCPDCALDISGGTDAVLYAAGLMGSSLPIPAFTYSSHKNRFFDVRNAPFAAGLPCDVVYSVEACFRMAGGLLRPGRVDQRTLFQKDRQIKQFFRLFLKHRTRWQSLINYIQRISYTAPEAAPELSVSGSYVVKADRGALIEAPAEALQDLERIGLIQDLEIHRENGVRFRFRDFDTRLWLRDIGIVLELYVFNTCNRLKIFDDVRLSAVVDWESDGRNNPVQNELDVMCTRGITPVFLSCKTGSVKTEALNELAVLRDRFGGSTAKAAVITAERGSAIMRSRAEELQIRVIDLEDLTDGRLSKKIKSLIKS